MAKSAIFNETDIKNTGENNNNLRLCSMCLRDIREPYCKYDSCDKFEYRDSVNYLCEACVNECKQYAHVDILRCVKYKKRENAKEHV